ncbi:sugar kinase [Nocardioides sp.]|uniref:sugar kinase n=1 Tax=Nocardioides sp. TaxID=35761 RepID=UPI002634B758|nr:sugar kinase [Nocardioides sp.]MDI6910363.1 sugar kinase [Nocardioides sp.]
MSGHETAEVELVTMGETMALLTHLETTPLRHARQLELGVGGSESNVAIGAARLGIVASWTGRVGGDELGHLVLRELRAEGVRVHASMDASRPTGIMLKAPRTGHSTHVTYYRTHSAGSALGPDDVDVEQLQNARVFHTSAITPALSQSAADAVRKSVQISRDSDTIVSIDLNFRRALWSEDEAREEFRWLAANADVVFASEAEARIACPGQDATTLAHELAALGGGIAIVKRGPLGAVASIHGHDHMVEPIPVQTVDPVGAGDAFAAGFLAALIRDGAPTTGLRWAALMGAWAATTKGDWQGLPSLEDLESLRHPGDDVLR